MAVKLFALWDVPKLERHIERLETQIASGVQTVSTAEAGSSTFMTISQTVRMLDSLYARLEEKTGRNLRGDSRMTVINIDVRKKV